jgi:hypothetical protein
MVRREQSERDYVVPYFKELVESALARQRLSANELTAFYIVHLLASFLRRDDATGEEQPLAARLAKALEAGGVEQRAGLKSVGDHSLFVSGFFSDSLRRKLVDIDYYITIGGSAYHALSRVESATFSPVFAELGDKFVAFVDVLNEVSERTACATNADLLRLYERWVRTGSTRSGQLLLEKGVIPLSAARTTGVQ